jgi:hypothetical protein
MKTRNTFSLKTVALASLAVAIATTLNVSAAKPPGSTPTGTIYFRVGSDEAAQAFTMKPDGAQKAALGVGYGSPSAQTHGGQRWFLQRREIIGENDLGGFPRQEFFAVREDGTAAVQLTDDPAMTFQYLQWTPAENATAGTLAGTGWRWNPDGTKDLGSLGVYTATLRFDANGNVTGLDAPPAFLLSVGITELIEGEGFYPDAAYGISFSPDMTKLAVDHLETGLGWRIFDLATGVQTTIVTGFADAPAWSPDGGKIAFRVRSYPDRIDVVSANGSGRVTAFKAARNDYVDAPHWSPDSAHLMFALYSERIWPPTVDVYRVPATGSSAVNLTKDIADWAVPLGWR